MSFATSKEFVRFQDACKNTMTEIAFMNMENTDSIEDCVDVAFMALSYAFPTIDSISDTVTRRCAKSEIYNIVEICRDLRSEDKSFNVLQYIEENLTCESVFEDIINMQEDDDE